MWGGDRERADQAIASARAETREANRRHEAALELVRDQAAAIARLQRQLTIERLKTRFARQERDVFRRRWEKALRPKAATASPAERIEHEGRQLVAQAIAARTPAGDTQTAPLLQSYADRRAAELGRERRAPLELRDWQAIADEILEGERESD